jgi:glycosyltransferase involved in cell wall biosynthesis
MIFQSPRVSVLMPVFNAERFLGEAIDSLTRQTFIDLEIIVVDDGSTDTSGAIAERCASADGRIKVLHQDNAGICVALNRAAGLARGDLIARLDADDTAQPDRLQMQVEFMDANPAVVCCGSAIRYIDEYGKELRRRSFPLSNHEIQQQILSRGCYAHSAVIYRRAAFERVGSYRPSFDSVEDLDLFLRLSEAGEMANLPDHLCAYRLHHSQMTSKPSARHRLQAFLAAISAIERRRGRQEHLPDSSNLSELSVSAIEHWLADSEMTWTWHTVSAIYALHDVLPRANYYKLSSRLIKKLSGKGHARDALEVAVAVVRAQLRLK